MKIVASRRPPFVFFTFVRRFLLQVFHIYYITEAVIETFSTKKMSLKFPIISKFEILIKYLKNTLMILTGKTVFYSIQDFNILKLGCF